MIDGLLNDQPQGNVLTASVGLIEGLVRKITTVIIVIIIIMIITIIITNTEKRKCNTKAG